MIELTSTPSPTPNTATSTDVQSVREPRIQIVARGVGSRVPIGSVMRLGPGA